MMSVLKLLKPPILVSKQCSYICCGKQQAQYLMFLGVYKTLNQHANLIILLKIIIKELKNPLKQCYYSPNQDLFVTTLSYLSYKDFFSSFWEKPLFVSSHLAS